METVAGCAFPFRLDPATGGIAWTRGPEKLKENLIQIILTGLSERVMRRDYGGGIRELVHDPNDEVLMALVQHQLARAIAQWEPRVDVHNVSVTQQQGTFFATLQYSIRKTQEIQLITVPVNIGGV